MRQSSVTQALNEHIAAFQEFKETFAWRSSDRAESRTTILGRCGATAKEWNDWQWQMKHRICTDIDAASLGLSRERVYEVGMVGTQYRWAVSPYYASLIDFGNENCPLGRMVLPTSAEVADPRGTLDPMAEETTSPAPCVTQRYPDRLILNVTNVCASYCRFCQRRRHTTAAENRLPLDLVRGGIQYIRSNQHIRDVLITGGDPLTLSDDFLDDVVGEVRSISHVEIIRIGSRVPATLPQRITDDLCYLLKRYHPVMLSTHFNHPLEVTEEVALAAERLANAGVMMNNQSVLLRGVNDDPFVHRLLCQVLLKNRIRPYYLFHPKQVQGTGHFWCSIEEGLRLMASLRGVTSGLAIPTYVLNAPGGMGKIPMLPNYIVEQHGTRITFRTWEGKLVEYDPR